MVRLRIRRGYCRNWRIGAAGMTWRRRRHRRRDRGFRGLRNRGIETELLLVGVVGFLDSGCRPMARQNRSNGRIQQKMCRLCACSISIFVRVVLPENSRYFACRGPAMKSNHQLRAFPVETSKQLLSLQLLSIKDE